MAQDPSPDGASAVDSTAEAKAEPLLVIVNKDNAVTNLTSGELRKLVLGEHMYWPDKRKVTTVLCQPGQPERQAVLQAICQMDENGLSRHFRLGTFAGKPVNEPKKVANSDNVRRFVFNVPGGLGFIRAHQKHDDVKVITVDGHAPESPGYPLKTLLQGPPDSKR